MPKRGIKAEKLPKDKEGWEKKWIVGKSQYIVTLSKAQGTEKQEDLRCPVLSGRQGEGNMGGEKGKRVDFLMSFELHYMKCGGQKQDFKPVRTSL